MRIFQPRRFLMVLVLVVGAETLGAQPPRLPPPEDTVTVSGSATVRAAPDRALVSITAESRAKRPREAQEQNARAMTGAREAIAAAGIPDSALRTTQIHLGPEFDWVDGQQRLRGYLARNTIEVRVDKLGDLGGLLDAVVGAGATSISGIAFDLADREALERQALTSAVRNARARAEAMAAGAGREIAHIVRIEDGARAAAPEPRMYAMARVQMESVETPVAPGELEITASVTLTAALK